MPDRAVIVHDLDQARAAVAAAADCGVTLMLWSAPGAAASLGAPVFRQIVDHALAEHPDLDVTAVLDCGDDAALALNALRNGIQAVHATLRPEVAQRVRDIAAQSGAVLIDTRPEALDLGETGDAPARCRAWLDCEEQADRRLNGDPPSTK